MKKRRTRDLLWERTMKVADARLLAFRRFEIARDLRPDTVFIGHWLAYLFDSTNLMDTLYRVSAMKRVTANARISFNVAEKMLLANYEKSRVKLIEAMLKPTAEPKHGSDH